MQDLEGQNSRFIWFIDKNQFTLATVKTSAATKKKAVGAKRFLRTRMTFSQSLTVSVACRNWTTPF